MSEEETITSPIDTGPITFSPPFDDLHADVVLRAADNVHFRVFKVILSKSSPFFDAMFSLSPPSPDVLVKGEHTEDGLQIVPVTESSGVITNLLTFCYPLQPPRLTTFEDALQFAVAADKYQVTHAVAWGLEKLSGLVTVDPVRMYVSACRHGWEEVARLSARQCLSLSLDEVFAGDVTEMEDINGKSTLSQGMSTDGGTSVVATIAGGETPRGLSMATTS